METKKVTLINDFHKTTHTMQLTSYDGKGLYLVSQSQARRSKKALCGLSDCQCSNEFGQRAMASDYDWTKSTSHVTLIIHNMDCDNNYIVRIEG